MAQYYTDFSGDTPGIPPVGWTPRWSTSGSPAWTVVAGGTFVGGQATRFTATNNSYRGLTRDDVDLDADRADVEVLVRFRIGNFSDYRAIAVVRGADSPQQNFYQIGIGESSLLLRRRLNGSTFELGSFGIPSPLADSVYFWARLRAEGSNIKAKLWHSGTVEPVAWGIEAVDTEVVDPGWVGALAFGFTDTQDFDVISIATDGETAAFSGEIPQAAEEEASQVSYLTTTDAEPDLQLSQVTLTALGIYPAEFLEASQVTLLSTGVPVLDTEVSQLSYMVLGRGRIEDPKLRAWTFSLDGHDFYVLRLGDETTLVYDVYSEQWIEWTSPQHSFWRANTGINWIGGQGLANDYGSDVVVGDDVHGLLYFLDPEQPYDQTTIEEAPVQERYFERVVMGQVPVRGRNVVPCFVVWLTTDMGNPAYSGAGVTLYASDDGGETFDDYGLVSVTQGDFSPELSWYSLGQIEAPGRLFKLVDDGAIVRIDGLEMNDNGE